MNDEQREYVVCAGRAGLRAAIATLDSLGISETHPQRGAFEQMCVDVVCKRIVHTLNGAADPPKLH